MIEEIFAQMPAAFKTGSIDKTLSFYFSIDDFKKTVFIDPHCCRVEEGKVTDTADCVCKTDPEFFARIWNDGYRPGLQDFLAGKIRSNNPEALKTFLTAFGKQD